MSDENPRLSLVPPVELEPDQGEPSNVEHLPANDHHFDVLARKHRAEIDRIIGYERERADLLVRHEQNAAELARMEAKYAEGHSIAAELDSTPEVTPSLIQRWAAWLDRDPASCIFFTGLAMFGAYHLGKWALDLGSVPVRVEMKRDVRRSLAQLRADAQSLNAQMQMDAREWLMQNGEVHIHNEHREVIEENHHHHRHHTSRIVERAKWRNPPKPKAPKAIGPTDAQCEKAMRAYIEKHGIQVI